jgi:hypothetical protein
METIDKAKLESSIESALGMSGGLFQRHPEHPDYETTRPGARPGEIACFVRRVARGLNEYISVVSHTAGEEDEDGYTWQNDCYEVVFNFADGDSETTVVQSRQDVVDAVVGQMLTV